MGLRYNGAIYIVHPRNYYPDTDEESWDFYWTEGNMGCDCNRSLLIRNECDPDFPDLPCGEEIQLEYLRKVVKGKHPGEWLPYAERSKPNEN